jgi:beta-lactamase superfamily II metal-dependent hydrolase
MRIVIATVSALLLCAFGVSAAKPLEIYFIDTEGGQATLMVTPSGESVLIDAGYGARGGRGGRGPVQPADRDANRIVDAAKSSGLDRIDYLIITHFHPDHAGGVSELAARMPIGTFIDYGEPLGTPYGPDRMTGNTFANYEQVRAKGKHMLAMPGGRIPLKGVDAQIVSAGGAHITRALPEGGDTNSACSGLEDHPEDGTENYRSVAVIFKYGAFRFLNVGDLSGNTLTRLACPKNLIGRVSAFVTPHHGDYDSSVPSLYAALQPRVVVMNNSAVANHGGYAAHFRAIRQQPTLEDLWQLHLSSIAEGENSPDQFLANVDDGRTTGFAIKLAAQEDGSFTVTNTRNGFTKAYGKKPTARPPVSLSRQ